MWDWPTRMRIETEKRMIFHKHWTIVGRRIRTEGLPFEVVSPKFAEAGGIWVDSAPQYLGKNIQKHISLGYAIQVFQIS